MVRVATMDDLEALVAGNRAMALETEGLELELEVVTEGVRAVLRRERPGAYYVIEQGGRVAAQLMITYEWSDWRCKTVWWIQSVYVVPELRGRGLYRRLYHEVQARARAAGAAGLRLYVDARNTDAQAVYARLGMDGEHYQLFEHMF